MGVKAMLESIDLVRDGKAPRIKQDASKATYESWCRKKDAEIDWNKPVDQVYNLIRGTNPQPGAWTKYKERTLEIYDSAKETGTGTPGTVIDIGPTGIAIATQGGCIRVQRVKPDDGAKQTAAEFAATAGLGKGDTLG